MECAKVPCDIRKAKKKQVKDELERIKQAEKKKRRLEKALANSAAIRSELEKKKQKKKEEQERLDEEGAAIAEAVALHVLLGEDSNESCKVKDEGFDLWGCPSKCDLFMGGRKAVLPHQGLLRHSLSNVHISETMWNDCGNASWTVSAEPFVRDFDISYFNEQGWEAADISTGVIAAQAVSSLRIAEDAHVDTFVFNQMLRG